MYLIIILLMLGMGGNVLGQAPDTLWTRTYGGVNAEFPYSIETTNDGGSVIAGWVINSGIYDVYVVRVNSIGDTLWTRTYGGASWDEAFSIVRAGDDGFIIAGRTESFGSGQMDAYVIRIDSQGDTVWTRCFGGSGWDEVRSVAQTSDGGFILVGSTESFGVGDPTYSNVYAVRIDSLGNLLWAHAYGGNGLEGANSVCQSFDGGFIFAGYTTSFGLGIPSAGNVYVVKVDNLGDTLWTRTFGGIGAEQAWTIKQTADNGYIVAGNTNSFGRGGADVYLVKLMQGGEVNWERTFGGEDNDEAFSVQESIDHGFVVCGQSYSFGAGGADIYLVKASGTGMFQWTRTIGGVSDDGGYSLVRGNDGGYLVTGYTQSYGEGYDDFYLIKIGPDTYQFENPCQSTDIPFLEEFSSASLDSCWFFAGQNSNQWSLSERVGWMRIIPDGRIHWSENDATTVLLRSLPDTNFVVTTKLDQGNGANYWSGLIVYLDMTTFVDLMYNGNVFRSHFEENDILTYEELPENWNPSFLRITKLNDTYSAYASPDSIAWYFVASWVANLAQNGQVFVGIATEHWSGGDAPIADFDFVSITDYKGILTEYPNGNEQFSIFSTNTILWSKFGVESGVSIEINRHYPIGAWESITDSTENDGAYEWFVTDPLSDSCRIRICALQDTFCDVSDGNFSIVSSQGYLALVRSSQPNAPLTSWNFGAVECPNTASQWFRLKNFGSESIVVFQPLEPASSEFSRNSPCGTFFALAPNQMSACSVQVVFDPANDGVYADVLRVQTDAVNGVNGFVEFALAGEQISTPAAPEVVITTQGLDAHLSWSVVDTSIGGCAVSDLWYAVFYSPTSGGPFYYHGWTPQTTYTHVGVVNFSPTQFYQVVAVEGSVALAGSLVRGMEMSEALRLVAIAGPETHNGE